MTISVIVLIAALLTLAIVLFHPKSSPKFISDHLELSKLPLLTPNMHIKQNEHGLDYIIKHLDKDYFEVGFIDEDRNIIWIKSISYYTQVRLELSRKCIPKLVNAVYHKDILSNMLATFNHLTAVIQYNSRIESTCDTISSLYFKEELHLRKLKGVVVS